MITTTLKFWNVSKPPNSALQVYVTQRVQHCKHCLGRSVIS